MTGWILLVVGAILGAVLDELVRAVWDIFRDDGGVR